MIEPCLIPFNVSFLFFWGFFLRGVGACDVTEIIFRIRDKIQITCAQTRTKAFLQNKHELLQQLRHLIMMFVFLHCDAFKHVHMCLCHNYPHRLCFSPSWAVFGSDVGSL